ncbi:cystathionine gamma-synthase [uncultured Microbacterium sp.]|jgi:cystathionine gamma-synthase|uniref:cystathionine gamma-synthase n=1 Tax=uncultured Microbacterium sp. TaxID=191216 RepID=UPI00263731C5|nr:cystathionine gamma-synthase [uncultured Microbacterium sp.]
MSDRAFATRAIHAGQTPDPVTGAIVPPIYQASTHVQDGINVHRGGFEYNRAGNPTRSSLETQVAALEGGASAYSFASGLAAEDALLRGILKPGDHVLLGADVYGGTYRLLDAVLVPWGITVSTADLQDLDAVRAALRPETRIVWLETPSNPLLKIVDIAAVAEIAHAGGALLVADNTFASPALQRPLELGADAVVHSTTKYLGGHSDVLGGAVVLGDDRFAQAVSDQQFVVGAVSAPMDAWLTTRGIKTLSVRVRQHCENAQALAEWAAERPEFSEVYYPGLPSHPGHDIAARQMSGFGGMLSLGLAAGPAAARAFTESTTLFQLAESLGGVESLLCYPPEMTHAALRGTPLAVPENIVRLSVGIEDVADLIADLEETLERIAR